MSDDRLDVLKAPITKWEDACKQQVSFKLRRILFELDLWNTKVARTLKDQIPTKKLKTVPNKISSTINKNATGRTTSCRDGTHV